MSCCWDPSVRSSKEAAATRCHRNCKVSDGPTCVAYSDGLMGGCGPMGGCGHEMRDEQDEVETELGARSHVSWIARPL